MSNELIEQLRACAKARFTDLMPHTAILLCQAADALEAKAAPVGGCLCEVCNGKGVRSLDELTGEYMTKPCTFCPDGFEVDPECSEQASAAHQRQQAREVVMPELLRRVSDLIEGLEGLQLPGALPVRIEKAKAALDKFARLNKGAGSHE